MMHVRAIEKYCPQHGIDTSIELVSFLSQVLHETGGFKWLREIWTPTKQQLRYERDFSEPWPEKIKGKRNYLATMLGNSEKGDGKLFMGRGDIQTTGRANYMRMSKEMFGDDRLLKNPELLTAPEYAMQSACIYWKWRKLDLVDDDYKIEQETKAVNGGFNGLDDRQKYFDRGCKVFNLKN